jgi:hypothetical protein
MRTTSAAIVRASRQPVKLGSLMEAARPAGLAQAPEVLVESQWEGAPMTEAEWLASTNCTEMLTFCQHRVPLRKVRLFGCAWCRRWWHLLTDERSRAGVEAGERLADSTTPDEDTQYEADIAGYNAAVAADELHINPDRHDIADRYYFAARAVEVLPQTMPPNMAPDMLGLIHKLPRAAACEAEWAVLESAKQANAPPPDPDTRSQAGVAAITAEHAASAALLREVLGNLFRPITFSPAWRTDTVLTLAQQMYDSRDFSAMPILADALQDAGCEDEAILTHCRGPGPHVRGCHVVDACLSRS